MDDDAFTHTRGRERSERGSLRAQSRRSWAEERAQHHGASARRILDGHELLSDDELERLERQVTIAQTARERDDLHKLRLLRLRLATAYLAVTLVCAAVTIAGGVAAGVTLGEMWEYVTAGA